MLGVRLLFFTKGVLAPTSPSFGAVSMRHKAGVCHCTQEVEKVCLKVS